MKQLIKRTVTHILLLSVVTQNTSAIASETVSAKGRPAPIASPTASASPTPGGVPVPKELIETRALLGKCDKALSLCDTLIKDKDETIKQQDEILRATDKELADLKSDRDNILKNPILWGVVGALVGALAAGAIASRR